MKWYEEVTRELLIDFKGFALRMGFNFFGPTKPKINKDQFKDLVLIAQCRGSVSTLDELLKIIDKEEKVDKDFVLANIHLMRMNIWNEAASVSTDLKKIDIITAMKINPCATELVYTKKNIRTEVTYE